MGFKAQASKSVDRGRRKFISSNRVLGEVREGGSYAILAEEASVDGA